MEISTLAGMSTRQYITLLLLHKSAFLWSLCELSLIKFVKKKQTRKKNVITVLLSPECCATQNLKRKKDRESEKRFEFCLYISFFWFFFRSVKPKLEFRGKRHYVGRSAVSNRTPSFSIFQSYQKHNQKYSIYSEGNSVWNWFFMKQSALGHK